jgi:hypothetical protein
MDQRWFEMHDLKKDHNRSIWVPLFESYDDGEGDHGVVGYTRTFVGYRSIAVPKKFLKNFPKINFTDIYSDFKGFSEKNRYTPSDIEQINEKIYGVHLVLIQRNYETNQDNWFLHQDLMLTLNLIQDGDIWFAQNEGYSEAVRLLRKEDGAPRRIQIRADFLKDYLKARNMNLFLTSYSDRVALVEDASFINWKNGTLEIEQDNETFHGYVRDTHEGSSFFRDGALYVHVTRSDDENVDIPEITFPPDDKTMKSKMIEVKPSGRKVKEIFGRLWRNEWIIQAKSSPRVKGDPSPRKFYYITDENGSKETNIELRNCGKWLWFKPDVIMTLTSYRGGNLQWYSKDTGSISCSQDFNVDFGMNSIGLINVYAKDVISLPDWQQQIWNGFNVPPDGGLSYELRTTQYMGNPVISQAPEEFLPKGLFLFRQIFQDKFDINIFNHDFNKHNILQNIHRFRALSLDGLFSLSKDVSRVSIDIFNTTDLKKLVQPQKEEKLGSLKLLEKLLATKIDPKFASEVMSPFHGVYNLRICDSHFPSDELDEFFNELQINKTDPFVLQGQTLLSTVVNCIYLIIDIIDKEF